MIYNIGSWQVIDDKKRNSKKNGLEISGNGLKLEFNLIMFHK